MYHLITEASFDSAHFLPGYIGKCSNLHGHRWRVVAEIEKDSLGAAGRLRGMVADFGDLKRDLNELTDSFDHALIIEEGSLKETTLMALREEEFKVIEVPFRPTAEELARYFYICLAQKGYQIGRMTVYETPNNCAAYTKEEISCHV